MRPVLSRLLTRWRSLNEWLRAAVIALLALTLVQVFVLRFVSVRSTSMYATLLPGDLVAVTKWNSWTGFQRGDVVVFRDPVQDGSRMASRPLLIKRIVGAPGDTLRLIDGALFVNGERASFHGVTHSHLVRLKKHVDPASLLASLGLPKDFAPRERSFIELPLDKPMAKALAERDDVLSAELMRTARGAPRHIFPFSPAYPWNSDDYGPIIVPRRGDTLRLNAMNLALYDRIISRYEGHALGNSGDAITIDGRPTDRYVVEQDHWFVLGDCRHYSTDSRYWGFLPNDHLVGRAAFIVVPASHGSELGDRWFKGL